MGSRLCTAGIGTLPLPLPPTHTQHHHLPAAGVIPIANDSGGPRADIVVQEPLPNGGQQRVGFLASTADEYAEAIAAVRCWGWGCDEGI